MAYRQSWAVSRSTRVAGLQNGSCSKAIVQTLRKTWPRKFKLTTPTAVTQRRWLRTAIRDCGVLYSRDHRRRWQTDLTKIALGTGKTSPPIVVHEANGKTIKLDNKKDSLI